MINDNSPSLSEQNVMGEPIHRFDQSNPLALGFGSCCCSSSCSAATYVRPASESVESH
jgi:hypothetical protein